MALVAAVTLVSTGVSIAGLATSAAATPVTGAGFTTTDFLADGGNFCLNGNPNATTDINNCNLYEAKQYVWLGGGPTAAALGDGDYFFAVLAPGGQANPNDGSPLNLSDGASGDAEKDRTFHVSGGTVTYAGPHDHDGNKIRLANYDDTPNPGGVYILAICAVDTETYATVAASSCKYDAFKVNSSGGGDGGGNLASDPTVTKDATGAYTTTYVWDVKKTVNKAHYDAAAGADVALDYSVDVTHDGGTVSGVSVTGVIDVENPNFTVADGSFTTLPVMLSSVTDTLSDHTVCTVDESGMSTALVGGTSVATSTLTLKGFDNYFPYSCSLSALPATDPALNNTVGATWATQTLSDGSTLSANSAAPFTFLGIGFTETKVGNCATLSDDSFSLSGAGIATSYCNTDPSPTTISYTRHVTAPTNLCTTFDNTATLTPTGEAAQTSSASADVCGPAYPLTIASTPSATYTRTYAWGVTKTLTSSPVVRQSGGSTTLTYNVSATHDAGTPSAWSVTGTATITNPNPFAVALTSVGDTLAGTTCSISGPPTTVPAAGTAQFGYTCTPSGNPGASSSNVASASWDTQAGSYEALPHHYSGVLAGATATDTKVVDWTGVSPTIVNGSATVTDTFNGGTAELLGALTYLSPATNLYTLSKSASIPRTSCQMVENRADITSGLPAFAYAKVCGVVGGLTMGFWQGPNGQALITNCTGPSATSMGLIAFFKQYEALRPLAMKTTTVDATCAQLAVAVNSAVKAANAGNAGMNVMLQAQMMATALDVWFSGVSGPGGAASVLTRYNGQITGYLGNVVVDLTKVWSAPAPGSTSAAFGNVSSATVLTLLAGGSADYSGATRATQTLAKDTFDAINNGQALMG